MHGDSCAWGRVHAQTSVTEFRAREAGKLLLSWEAAAPGGQGAGGRGAIWW